MTESLPAGLTGIIPIRDGILCDYCPELGVESMLPVCDEVIISDGRSTDGTREFFQEWATREPKLRVVDYDFPENLTGDPWFLSKWLNWTQQFARFSQVCALDADEVFDPLSYPAMRESIKTRESFFYHRVNLWKDPQHEAPHGTVCAHLVVRSHPTSMPLICDNMFFDGQPEALKAAKFEPSLRIWHLGFLRDKKKFLIKSRREQWYLLNAWDERLQRAEDTGEDWVELTMWKDKALIEHKIKLPEFVKPWLTARGHTP